MKTNVLITMLALSFSLSTFAQATLGDGPGNASQKICESSDPLLSAAEIECYPENNLMVIREPKYKYEGKQRSLIRKNGSHPYLDEAESICKSFGSETGELVGELEYSTFWLYGKASIQYYSKSNIHLEKQGPTSGPISTLRCQIYFEGVKTFKNDDGSIGCYQADQGKRGKKVDDGNCHSGHEVIKATDGRRTCFKTFKYNDKAVPFEVAEKFDDCRHGQDFFKAADGANRCFNYYRFDGKNVPYGYSLDDKECEILTPLSPF